MGQEKVHLHFTTRDGASVTSKDEEEHQQSATNELKMMNQAVLDKMQKQKR